MIKYEIRNRYQAEGLTFLTSDELFHSKLLALATGYGKTYTAVMAAFRLKLPILIISETLVQKSSILFLNCVSSGSSPHAVSIVTDRRTAKSIRTLFFNFLTLQFLSMKCCIKTQHA